MYLTCHILITLNYENVRLLTGPFFRHRFRCVKLVLPRIADGILTFNPFVLQFITFNDILVGRLPYVNTSALYVNNFRCRAYRRSNPVDLPRSCPLEEVNFRVSFLRSKCLGPEKQIDTDIDRHVLLPCLVLVANVSLRKKMW